MGVIKNSNLTSSKKADIWVSRFEEALTKLEDEREGLSDRSKKIFFLNNIIDLAYKIVKTILESENDDYEKCVLEVRKASIGIERNRRFDERKGLRSNRKSYNMNSYDCDKRYDSNKFKGRMVPKIQNETWWKLPQKQRNAIQEHNREYRKSKRNGNSERDPENRQSRTNNVNTTPDGEDKKDASKK